MASSKTKTSGGLSQSAPQTPVIAATDKTVSHVLGEICWLMSQSPVHKQMFLGDLEWFAMPAILLEQFRTFNGPQHPVGVAFWATVSEETEQRLLQGANKIRADEWKNGDRPWLIELLAPFGGQDEMLVDFGKHIFPDRSFKFHYVTPQGQREVKDYRDHIMN